MKRILICAMILAAALCGAENLVVNSRFESDQYEYPDNWEITRLEDIVYERAGAPDGNGSLTIRNGVHATIRQRNYKLIAGEKYRLSGMIKTKGFTYRRSGLVIYATGWKKDAGIDNGALPADTPWKRFSTEIIAPESSDKVYDLAFYVLGAKGEVSIADIRLEPISKLAKEQSSGPMQADKIQCLVALEPLLDKIPADDPRLTLLWHGKAATGCNVSVDGATARFFKFENNRTIVDFKGLPGGKHTLEASVAVPGRPVFTQKYDFTIITPPILDTSKVRELNSLVSELLKSEFKNSGNLEFTNPRDGWVFIRCENRSKAPKLALSLNGDIVTTDNNETMRFLPAGTHKLTLESEDFDGTVTVHSIPEILNCQANTGSFVFYNGKYDWEFQKKHIMPACTTLNSSHTDPKILPEVLASGRRWLVNMNIWRGAKEMTGADLTERVRAHHGMTKPDVTGITEDEMFYSKGVDLVVVYTEAMKNLRDLNGRLLYTWASGKPSLPGIHHDFMASSLNVGGGTGRLLYECYAHPQPDEESVRKYLDGKILDTARAYKQFLPHSISGFGIVLGNFNQMPVISIDHLPEVDYKYFLDMQLNLIANSPECRGLAVTGYWGSHYSDEELLRWSFKLMRHYAVEGNKEMLSDRYGFKYRPGHLQNCDFADGLKHWENSGEVKTDFFKTYAQYSQKRWGAPGGIGDTFAVLRPGAKVSQTARNLVPGKLYTLQFATADANDIKNKKVDPKKLDIQVKLTGAKTVRSNNYVDQKNPVRRPVCARINYRRIIFRATAAEHQLEITNTMENVDLALNFVQMKPYFEK